MQKWTYLVCGLILGLGACRTIQPAGKAILPAARLQPMGRALLTDQGHLELISSGAQVGFSFTGTSCTLYTHLPRAEDHNFLQYTLDGVYQRRLRLDGRTPEPLVISAPGSGRHTVWLIKASEAHSGPIFIEKISGSGLRVLPVPARPWIEFIGNSITCGAAADTSLVPCGQGAYHDQHDAYHAYGARLARALNMNYLLSSVSGIGIYRTWNRDGPAMPEVYERADFQLNNGLPWDFTRFTPAVVVISLGTNDLSAGDGVFPRPPFAPEVFIEAYVSFVRRIKSHHPRAQIVLLNSPLVGTPQARVLEEALDQVKQQLDRAYPQTEPVQLLRFQPLRATGCTGHPNVQEHGLLAEQLLPQFNALLQKLEMRN